ncbi:MAG: hypothetical protein A2626_02605 [Candidatus Nealsonbacteria bacterium RIFCSPHIGHO2_01_FULL_38_55]|uniref:HTH HARE-type domain-containing protein n=2 Tax=Candidatus Nealsoniibacteriota TaxID=1817911 RepID=A0A1G2EHX2_9BACT|nr:MAG: RNA polymerase sigma factor [Parcubacteria group bacterium GW2011_GWA2_38_27]KKQ96086.1 MAG: RNA polymerase sigma factor [Parcubacteria group bacterium GW2011_GWC2_39_11]OGZ19806.1 MAG: hypothetical protein A2626_02605 [Candidatus Nealsonbacteria bacterium RIFCSPHIGHO2_01_FULL_38_55]OGZ21756.1 MAG: hypothetical protein A3C48_02830 [Candidatus Nealsonbacteria bacterium RIFCSPHIGHO2_02_FULL_38_75]OGZ21949.1 MAG: hypothetical protein A2W55_00495 [Candidatus Nealsonbacteria bacterium RIFCSP
MELNYKKICSGFLRGLPQRTINVIERRFGLKTGKRETLDAIGQNYEITRERVRQIAEAGLAEIKPKAKAHENIFADFSNVLESFGGIKKEDIFLDILAGKKFRNEVFFLLNLSGDFSRIGEDDSFYSFWTKSQSVVDSAKKAVELVSAKLRVENKLFSINELFALEDQELGETLGKKISDNVFASYVEISKEIQKNPEGRLGLKNWLEINPRGIKDKAYLVFKKQEKPLHFAQVASLIGQLPFPSERKAHIATVHNELIKDDRFVLVGRGLYALKEWGYAPGLVKDVIIKTIKEANAPLSKEEILNKVLKQRFVKQNTVLLNLNNRDYFLKDSRGKYTIKEA